MESEDKLNASVLVSADTEKTFYAFAQQMTSWWPREYTWSTQYLGHIVLEGEANGAWYETDGAGVRQPDWGTVLQWEPPHLLRLSWAITGDRKPEVMVEKRSAVTIRLIAQGSDATLVELEHAGFSKHGDNWEPHRNAMAGPDGWPKILEDLATFTGRSQGEVLLGLGTGDDGTRAPFADATSTVPGDSPAEEHTSGSKLPQVAMAGVGALVLFGALTKVRKHRRDRRAERTAA